MDWKDKLKSAQQAGEKMLDLKTEKAIEENWPKIQQVFQEKVGPAALAAAKNDEQMQSLFKLVYAALPFPVHRSCGRVLSHASWRSGLNAPGIALQPAGILSPSCAL